MKKVAESTFDNPFEEGVRVKMQAAVLWVVDPSRGDLYVVSMLDKDVLVQLLDGGIANRPDQVLGAFALVLVDDEERVVGLPLEGGGGWMRCKRLRD